MFFVNQGSSGTFLLRPPDNWLAGKLRPGDHFFASGIADQDVTGCAKLGTRLRDLDATTCGSKLLKIHNYEIPICTTLSRTTSHPVQPPFSIGNLISEKELPRNGANLQRFHQCKTLLRLAVNCKMSQYATRSALSGQTSSRLSISAQKERKVRHILGRREKIVAP